jgi:hypothetical protein
MSGRLGALNLRTLNGDEQSALRKAISGIIG